jgi:hypothetical protein
MSCGATCTWHHPSFSHEDKLDTWWRHRARRYRYADFRTISNTDSNVGTGLRVQRTNADRRQVLIGPRCRVSREESVWHGAGGHPGRTACQVATRETSFAAPHEISSLAQSVGLPPPCESEQFCSVTVIDAAYIGERQSCPKTATYLVVSQKWEPRAVGRHDTKIEPRSALMPPAPASDRGQKPCKFHQFCGASR